MTTRLSRKSKSSQQNANVWNLKQETRDMKQHTHNVMHKQSTSIGNEQYSFNPTIRLCTCLNYWLHRAIPTFDWNYPSTGEGWLIQSSLDWGCSEYYCTWTYLCQSSVHLEDRNTPDTCIVKCKRVCTMYLWYRDRQPLMSTYAVKDITQHMYMYLHYNIYWPIHTCTHY